MATFRLLKRRDLGEHDPARICGNGTSASTAVRITEVKGTTGAHCTSASIEAFNQQLLRTETAYGSTRISQGVPVPIFDSG